MNPQIPYKFTHLQTALVGFIADLEKKINFVFPDIPVLFENIDDSYILLKKYGETELQELYSKLPRTTISVTDVQAQLEYNTTQFLKMLYEFNNEEWRTQFRRISTSLTVDINFVCPSYLSALSYWEFLLSIFCIDNTFTYKHLGLTFQASYLMNTTPNIEKTQLNNATSESKNTILKVTLEINTQPVFININTIENGDNTGSFIIDTDDIDGGTFSESGGVIYNSNINSTQELNDIGISEEQEKRLLSNRKKKIANNVFDIDVYPSDGNKKEVYNSKMNTNIYDTE